MRSKAGPVGLLALVGALVVLAFAASPAKAAFGIAEWEALTCKENVDTPLEIGQPNAVIGLFPLAQDPGQCNEGTPDKWFTQATGHPNFGVTDFTLNTLEGPGVTGFPDGPPAGFLKEIVVDTPEGLGVNPEATPTKCTVEQLSATPLPECPETSLVGFNYLTVAAQAPPCNNIPPEETPDVCINARVKIPVFNLVPFDGVPSMVGFPTSAPGEPAIIVGDLDPGDQHVRFTLSDIHAPDGTTEHPPIIGSRLVFLGNFTPGFAGNYLTMPSNCAGGQTSKLTVRAHDGQEDQASFTTAVGADECNTAPFNPDLGASAGGDTDSPGPATVDVQMPNQLAANQRGESHLLTAKVTLPEGSGLNPSVANGLVPCTDAQFKRGSDDPVECPASSRIGSVEVDTKALDQDLGGDVYVAQPLSNDPNSGEKFRIFIHAFNERYGVNVRLVGKVFPDPQTGQLTAVVGENPQAPFNSFKVHLEGGPRGAVTSPPTCGPHTMTADYTPWSRPGESVRRTAQFTLTTAPGGGPCAQTLGERPFDPGFAASTRSHKAGAYSPFDLRVERPDGEQELKQISVKLPPGMSAKLAGVAYCPPEAIAAASAKSGAEERANPSCPASSRVGSMTTRAGSGADPFQAAGDVYLSGPYKGAPISFVFVTPAVAGPYDLGNVVIHAAAYVDPETAQVTVISDEIPDVFGGVKLSVRSVDVSIDRQGYTINPTSCSLFAVDAGLNGGGSNPRDPAAWSSIAKNTPFTATDCNALRFKPKFFARILGGKKQTRRTANPKFQAILNPGNGEANLRRAALILPRATILDQSHIKTVCTRVQLAANNCPKGSIYGQAKATSPLLDGNLKGPVYLLSSSNKLPDMLVDLRGQVNVRLRGVISSQKGRLKTVFQGTPDVPVDKFTLNMKGGKQGLLINTRDLCKGKAFAYLNLKAHNDKRLQKKRLPLNRPACKKGGKGKKR